MEIGISGDRGAGGMGRHLSATAGNSDVSQTTERASAAAGAAPVGVGAGSPGGGVANAAPGQRAYGMRDIRTYWR